MGFGHARAHVGGAHGHHGRATHGPAEDHRPLATLPLPLDLGGDLGVDLGDLGELGRARGRGGGEALLVRLMVGVRDGGARTKARRCWFGLGFGIGSAVLSKARRASSCAANISLDLPISPHISPYLPISTHISQYLPVSPEPEREALLPVLVAI